MRARGARGERPAGRAGDGNRGFRNDAVVLAQRYGDTNHGITARRMTDLAIPEPRTWGGAGNVDRHQNLPRLKCGGHDVDEKILCRDTPAAGWASQLQFTLQRD